MSWTQRLSLAFKSLINAFRFPDEAKALLALPLKEQKVSESTDLSHLRLLAVLQQSARLVDFFKEDISAYDDAQVGAAVRKIHESCRACVEDLVTIRPIFDEEEGARIFIPKGYDPQKIKVVGKVQGDPPFTGYLVHKGWKAHKRSLPKNLSAQSSDIICPAEVEVR